ncbi:hypothetical protein HMPREF1022_00259 [Desulfovibrio sp. 6_1_46AFAA]|uniref:sel1 repeat family protein n=1 Tax=Desulfovibrio sp. 6_1_46AFAA TaxID=665942 RepID=UPI0002236FBB|nr:sel1 repeat family protein [Desulfovibrio sp. 6_1_46AFAA]EGW52781.1 hypothetical protein HMPREF1022_00259 [Desulfovibrio sp. 6_1_46AFAA]
MRATITADPSRGPGYGIIEIRDAGNVFAPAFVLRRGSDGKTLSSGGWQESETALTPDAWDNDGGSLRLAVGPAVVDEMDNLDAYRISLTGAGACVLVVQNLVYSHISGGQGVGVYAPPTEPLQAVPETEPAVEAPEPEPVVTEPPLRMAREPGEGKSGKGGLLVGLALLVLVAGVAVWWFMLRAPEKPPLPSAPTAAQNQTAPAASANQSPLAAAREQLRGEARPEMSLALAKPMRKAGAGAEESDAAFLLLEDAAQKGNAEAMLLVGQFYDPVSSLPRGSIPVDMGQAKHWYEQARQKGQAEAAKALDALRVHAQTEADKGNAEARSLLQNWK